MKPMISVIIPVYNAEDTVKKSIESAINQTVKDYELIVIDDGSEDSTSVILKQLASENPALKLLTISHQGAAAARNAGIKSAEGEYLYFADADDLMSPNAIETMENALKKQPCDLLTFGFRKINKKKNTVQDITAAEKTLQGSDIRKNFTAFGENAEIKVIGSCWNKVFKKELILDKSIHFPEELKRNEEEVFIMRYLNSVSTVHNIPDILYEFYPIDMEKAKRVMSVDFAKDVENFRTQRLAFAGKWNSDVQSTRLFIASEFWGKMMLALRLDKARGDYSRFEEHAKMLMAGLKDTGTIPGGIKKSKTYLLLKIHMTKQVYNSL